MSSKKRWGLVLSGGAAYGLANIGVIDVLERENLKPDYIAGSSMGAIVGAVYALGHPAQELHTIAAELDMLNVARLSKKPFKGGLHGGLFRPQLREILERHIGDATIADCTIPFVCVAGRVLDPVHWHKILRKGFVEHFLENVTPYIFPPETKVIDAILASSAIPVIFEPLELEGQKYVDLVHFGSIPSRIMRQTFGPDVIIATDTNPSYKALRKILPDAWDQFLQEGEKHLNRDREDADVLLVPEHPYAIFRFDRAEAFIVAGQKETQQKLPAIIQALKD